MNAPNLTGTPNLGRLLIAGPTGTLRLLAAVGDKAKGTTSEYGALSSVVTTNSDGHFFFTAILVDGKEKWGVFIDK